MLLSRLSPAGGTQGIQFNTPSCYWLPAAMSYSALSICSTSLSPRGIVVCLLWAIHTTLRSCTPSSLSDGERLAFRLIARRRQPLSAKGTYQVITLDFTVVNLFLLNHYRRASFLLRRGLLYRESACFTGLGVFLSRPWYIKKQASGVL